MFKIIGSFGRKITIRYDFECQGWLEVCTCFSTSVRIARSPGKVAKKRRENLGSERSLRLYHGVQAIPPCTRSLNGLQQDMLGIN
jgi:hypothetical protein